LNRKLTNKTYSYISTTIAIVGWIGLFAAFNFLWPNFQRTASVNQMKEITTDSSYVFDVNRESNETMWEKLLGNSIIADELLDEDEEHDFNRGGFSRAQVSLEGYDGKTIQIIQFARSNGLTRSEAEKNAKSIQYNYVVKGNQLVLDSHFGLKNFKFRNQRMRVKVLIPYGVTFSMTREFGYFMENVLDGGYFNEDDGDMFVGSKWTFSMDKGLICLNRNPKQADDSNDEIQDDSENFDEAPAAPTPPTGNFSISKTVEPFSLVELKHCGTAAITIVKGKEYKVSYQSAEASADFGKLTSVSNGSLSLNDIPNGMTVTIECPSLSKLDLGGNGRTEIKGFDVPSLDVILHDFHSLTLSGHSNVLAAAALDSSELLATNWKTDDARISVASQAKMELNVMKTLKGKKGERANLTYLPNSKLQVSLDKK
jgi:hypothetical protein